jgi:branched-chain amino acid transport system permease protein
VFGIEYQPDYDTLVYGGILLIIMLFLPEGIFIGLVKAISFIKASIKKVLGKKFSESGADRVE